MSKPYQPTGSTYRFTIIKDSNVEYYIGTEKGIKAYKPDKILKQELIDEHHTLSLGNSIKRIQNETHIPIRKVKEIGAGNETTHTGTVETNR